jgi:putative membrane protein insertion efficiency factor
MTGHFFAALHRLLLRVVLSPVVFYRRVLSPLKRTPTCRYLPTCSEYAIEALHERGIVVGSVLAMWRIVRCHPFARGGYDPVPSSVHDQHRCEEHA